MATIDFLMQGKKPGEIKIRRSGWPRSAWARPLSVSTENSGVFIEFDAAGKICTADDLLSTDWVIVTDAKRRRG